MNQSSYVWRWILDLDFILNIVRLIYNVRFQILILIFLSAKMNSYQIILPFINCLYPTVLLSTN